MKVTRFNDPASYKKAIWDFLYEEEGLNTIALGVIDQLLETPPLARSF